MDKDVTIGTTDASANLTVNGNTIIHQNLGVGGGAIIAGNTLIGQNLEVGGTINAGGVISAPDIISGGKSLNSELNRMDLKMNGIGASAAALAALEYDDIEEGQKWQIAAGVGNYNNRTAYALGAKYHLNKDISFHIGSTIGSTEKMVNGGFSIALGHAKPKVNKEYQEELEALKEAVKQLAMQNAEMAAKLNALTSIDSSKKKSFADVPKNHWAKEAVDTLYGNDEIQGYPDGEFKGDEKMTRYEYAQMLYNALKKGVSVDPGQIEEYGPELHKIASRNQEF